MSFVPAKSICGTKRCNYWLPLSVVLLLLVSGCVGNKEVSKANAARASKYSADALAKEWREQVRVNPNNPYETGGYRDNDEEYRSPKPPRLLKRKSNTSSSYEDIDNDSNYPKYPKYNPDDDNVYFDPKHYPLYMDY